MTDPCPRCQLPEGDCTAWECPGPHWRRDDPTERVDAIVWVWSQHRIAQWDPLELTWLIRLYNGVLTVGRNLLWHPLPKPPEE